MLTIDFRFERQSYKSAPRRLLHISDGDTPNIQMPIRMCNIDTPEKANYAGRPKKAQPKLDRAVDRLLSNQFAATPAKLREYFEKRVTQHAAAQHIDAASRATQIFQKYLDQRLFRDGRSRRRVGVFPQGNVIDSYGRLLAYTAPWYCKEELEAGADRTTFNINMIESGWAAFFPFYPTLPKNDDMNFALQRAVHAWENQLGVWEQYGNTFLLAYEYRMLVKLGCSTGDLSELHDEAFYRNCIDLRTLKDQGVYGFVDVPPPYRLWVKTAEMPQARADLGLD